MYVINGFKANVKEKDLRWLCVLMKTLSEWPDKSRSVYESVEKCGGFLLMAKPKDCLSLIRSNSDTAREDLCHLCRNCSSERDRLNLHAFLQQIYDIGQLKASTRGGVPLHLVRFMSIHGCQLFNRHKYGGRFKKPLA